MNLRAPGWAASPEVETLRGKLARNWALGWRTALAKGARFVASSVRARVALRAVEELGVGVRVEGLAPKFQRPGGTISLGDDVVLNAPVTPIYFGLMPGAFLAIGAESWLNDGIWFGCTDRITIGRRALIGPGVRIFDNDYHESHQRRRRPAARPVTIDDDVWISSGAIILPGVTIGRGAVIGASAVVHGEVAPFSIVAGSPARQIKALDPRRFEHPAQK